MVTITVRLFHSKGWLSYTSISICILTLVAYLTCIPPLFLNFDISLYNSRPRVFFYGLLTFPLLKVFGKKKNVTRNMPKPYISQLAQNISYLLY